MSADQRPLDDCTAEPWERVRRVGPALELVADERDVRQLQKARRLLESLEQRIQEET